MPLKAAMLLTLLLAPGLALRAAPVPTTRLRPHHVQQHVPALVMRRSTVPPRMVALPMCPAGGVLSLAVKAGCATVLAQLGLVAAFRSSSDPVLKQAPGYAAHQLVALVVMLYAYATEASNPGLADRVPGRPAAHVCTPCLAQHDVWRARLAQPAGDGIRRGGHGGGPAARRNAISAFPRRDAAWRARGVGHTDEPGGAPIA